MTRVDLLTSAAFFLSIEFQNTGYLVERIYKAAFGDDTRTSTIGGSHQLSVPIIRLNELLDELATIVERLVSVVELRYFAALEYDQIAECLGVTGRTVRRDLQKVRMLLLDPRE